MARNRFGGTASDFVFATYRFGGHDLVQLTTAQVTCWSAPSAVAGRVQYADLRLLDGTAVSAVQANEDGSLPEFDGPDDATVTRMWVSADGGATGVWLTTSSILPDTTTLPDLPGVATDAQLPARLSDAGLAAAYMGQLPDLTVTRNAAGRAVTVADPGGTTTYTRGPDGKVATVSRNGVTKTVTRAPSGLIEGIA